jgi:hypothetical protein
MKRVTVWVVTPHESSDYDEWWGPAETDHDHDAALEYAQARLVDIWDQYDGQDPRVVGVTLEQREVDEDEFELTQEEH